VVVFTFEFVLAIGTELVVELFILDPLPVEVPELAALWWFFPTVPPTAPPTTTHIMAMIAMMTAILPLVEW